MFTRVRAVAVATALSCLLLATGCGEDDDSPLTEPSPAGETSASPAAEVPNAEVMAETPTRPEDERSPQGAIAFGTYVVETVMHASSQNNADAMRSIDVAGTCTNCQRLAAAFEEAEAAGERSTYAEPVEVFDAQVAERGRGESTWLLLLPIRFPDVTTYDADGEVLEEYPAEVSVMEMGIKWVDDQWQLFEFRYADDEEES